MMRLLSYVALFSALVLLTPPVLAESKSSNDCHFVPQEKPTEVVVEYTSKLRVELSQLPEVRIVGVLEDRKSGKQIPMVWDPLESPRLSYVVTVDPGVWIFSFRSDPLYRTAETSRLEGQDRFSITYRAVVPSKQCPQSDCSALAECDNKNESTKADDSLIFRETIRLQPFNLFDYNDRKNLSLNKDNAKEDIIVKIYQKVIKSKSDKDEDFRKFAVSAASFLAQNGKNEISRNDVDLVIETVFKPICKEVENLTKQFPEIEKDFLDLCQKNRIDKFYEEVIFHEIIRGNAGDEKERSCSKALIVDVYSELLGMSNKISDIDHACESYSVAKKQIAIMTEWARKKPDSAPLLGVAELADNLVSLANIDKKDAHKVSARQLVRALIQGGRTEQLEKITEAYNELKGENISSAKLTASNSEERKRSIIHCLCIKKNRDDKCLDSKNQDMTNEELAFLKELERSVEYEQQLNSTGVKLIQNVAPPADEQGQQRIRGFLHSLYQMKSKIKNDPRHIITPLNVLSSMKNRISKGNNEKNRQIVETIQSLEDRVSGLSYRFSSKLKLYGEDIVEISANGAESERSVSEAIKNMGASEFRSASGRSLSDPVPQVVVDLFGILAEIAFDRAKTKGFAILSARATQLVCEELTGKAVHKEFDQKLSHPNALWWLPNDNAPLLPQTCATVRGLRVQEIATSGKSIYTALITDISSLPLGLLFKEKERTTVLLNRILELALDRVKRIELTGMLSKNELAPLRGINVRQSNSAIQNAIRAALAVELSALTKSLDEAKMLGLSDQDGVELKKNLDRLKDLLAKQEKSDLSLINIAGFLGDVSVEFPALRISTGNVILNATQTKDWCEHLFDADESEKVNCSGILGFGVKNIMESESLLPARNLILAKVNEIYQGQHENAGPAVCWGKLNQAVKELQSASPIANSQRVIADNIELYQKMFKLIQLVHGSKHWKNAEDCDEKKIELAGPVMPLGRILDIVAQIEQHLALYPRVDGEVKIIAEPMLKALAMSVKTLLASAESGAFGEREVQLAFLSFAKEFVRQSDELLRTNGKRLKEIQNKKGDSAPLDGEQEKVKEEAKIVQGLVCPVRFALAVVSACQHRGGCDAAVVASYLQDPSNFLDDDKCSPDQQQLQTWPEMAQFVSRALEVVKPTKATPPVVQLRNVSNLIFDVAERLLSQQKTRAFPLDKASLQAMRSIITGALGQDAQAVLIGFSGLVAKGLGEAYRQPNSALSPDADDITTTQFGRSLQKFSALAAAVSSYAQNYSSGDDKLDEKQAKAQRAIADAKTANRCQASRVSPCGTGVNQRPKNRTRSPTNFKILPVPKAAVLISGLLHWWEKPYRASRGAPNLSDRPPAQSGLRLQWRRGVAI